MLSDIQIAQACEKKKIFEIAEKLAIPEEYLELYGNYKAKIDYRLLKDLKEKKKLDRKRFALLKEAISALRFRA